MAKTLRDKKLVFIDFREGNYKFFNIEALSIGYQDIQVIYRYGKLGNKGRKHLERFQGKDSYKSALKFFYKKIYDKKTEGFISVEKMEEGIKFAIKRENQETLKNKNKRVAAYKCDVCNTPLNEKLYAKINNWGRKDGNWDYSKDSPLYKKVACLSCQIELDIFQKKVNENTSIPL